MKRFQALLLLAMAVMLTVCGVKLIQGQRVLTQTEAERDALRSRLAALETDRSTIFPQTVYEEALDMLQAKADPATQTFSLSFAGKPADRTAETVTWTNEN